MLNSPRLGERLLQLAVQSQKLGKLPSAGISSPTGAECLRYLAISCGLLIQMKPTFGDSQPLLPITT